MKVSITIDDLGDRLHTSTHIDEQPKSIIEAAEMSLLIVLGRFGVALHDDNKTDRVKALLNELASNYPDRAGNAEIVLMEKAKPRDVTSPSPLVGPQ